MQGRKYLLIIEQKVITCRVDYRCIPFTTGSTESRGNETQVRLSC